MAINTAITPIIIENARQMVEEIRGAALLKIASLTDPQRGISERISAISPLARQFATLEVLTIPDLDANPHNHTITLAPPSTRHYMEAIGRLFWTYWG